MKLLRKKIFITGGSRGIGKGLAKVFLKEGADVCICSRNEQELENAVSDLKDEGHISFLRADLTDINDIRLIKNELQSKYGELHVLVNNASILGKKSEIINYPEDLWKKVIEVNLNAQFYIIKALLPLIINTKNSSIINVSSSVGRKGRKLWGAYSVSKFGLESLTQILAQELADHGVRVNSVNPGGTRTQMRAMAYPTEDPEKLPTPEDITPVFVYLASDESIGVTGKEFNARDWIK